MNHTLNIGSATQRFKGSDAIEIRNRITFDFYMGLSHIFPLRGKQEGTVLVRDRSWTREGPSKVKLYLEQMEQAASRLGWSILASNKLVKGLDR